MTTDTNTYATITALNNAGGTAYFLLTTNVDGTSLELWDVGGNTTTGPTITVGTPFFWALTANASDTRNGYFLNAGDAALTNWSRTVGAGFTPTQLWLANDPFGEPYNGLIWNVRCWDRELTSAELFREAYSDDPVSLRSLHAWWPMRSANRDAILKDWSGNKRDLAFGGSPGVSARPQSYDTPQLWRWRRRIWGPGAASGSSGTFAVTTGAATSSFSGTTTIVGSLSRTLGNDFSSFSGTTTVVGSFSRTVGNATLSASGSVGSPVEGTFTVTIAGDTFSASGTTTVVGTFSRTTGADTLSASGTTTIVGTFARTLSNDTITASGTTTIVGTSTPTAGNDIMSASGSVGSAISGTFTPTTGNDTSSASGTTTIVGTFSYILSNNTLNSSGTTTIVGTFSRTLSNDTMSASGFPGAASPVSTWRTLTNIGP